MQIGKRKFWLKRSQYQRQVQNATQSYQAPVARMTRSALDNNFTCDSALIKLVKDVVASEATEAPEDITEETDREDDIGEQGSKNIVGRRCISRTIKEEPEPFYFCGIVSQLKSTSDMQLIGNDDDVRDPTYQPPAAASRKQSRTRRKEGDFDDQQPAKNQRRISQNMKGRDQTFSSLRRDNLQGRSHDDSSRIDTGTMSESADADDSDRLHHPPTPRQPSVFVPAAANEFHVADLLTIPGERVAIQSLEDQPHDNPKATPAKNLNVDHYVTVFDGGRRKTKHWMDYKLRDITIDELFNSVSNLDPPEQTSSLNLKLTSESDLKHDLSSDKTLLSELTYEIRRDQSDLLARAQARFERKIKEAYRRGIKQHDLDITRNFVVQQPSAPGSGVDGASDW